jgi:hypothetical protein
MGTLLKVALIVTALLPGVGVGFVFYNEFLSPDNWIYQGGDPSNWKDGGVHGAPSPIAGAGLPVLLIGGGIYWIVRRKRYADKPEA